MGRGVSEQRVFQAAESLLLAKKKPTIDRVIAHLGTGSKSTVGPMLKKWKYGLLNEARKKDTQEKPLLTAQAEEKQLLQQSLNKLHEQNALLAQNLHQQEKQNLSLEKTNQELSYTLNEMTVEQDKLTQENTYLSGLNQTMQAERETLFKSVVAEKNAEIACLQQEVKALNEKSIALLRQLSTDWHDKLMAEKVNTLKVQDVANQMKLSLEETKKSLAAIEQRLAIVQKENTRLQTLLNHFASFEDIQAYEKSLS